MLFFYTLASGSGPCVVQHKYRHNFECFLKFLKQGNDKQTGKIYKLLEWGNERKALVYLMITRKL